MASEWMPIETAPKDGERVLLWARGAPVVGYWTGDIYARTPRPYWTHDKANLWGVRDTRVNQPTHWMPLPAAPTEGTNP